MAQKTKKYERGYRPGLTKDAIRQLRQRFFEASPVKAVIFTLFYLFSTYLCAYTLYVLLTSDVPVMLAIPAGMGLALLITRQQRPRECRSFREPPEFFAAPQRERHPCQWSGGVADAV